MKSFISKLSTQLFSMRAMTLGLLVFLVAIGIATFIESTHGIQAAKILIYNGAWFEVLLIFLGLNLIANIYRYKMFQREKIAVLAFHLAFLIIILGSGITRFMGFEGIMVIGEGKTANFIYTSDPHILVKVSDAKTEHIQGYKKFLSEFTHNFGNDFSHTSTLEDKKFTFSYVDFKSKCIDSFRIDPKLNSKVIDVVTEGMQSHYLGNRESLMVGGVPLIFGGTPIELSIHIKDTLNQLMIQSAVPMRSLAMTEMQRARQTGQAPPDSLYTEYEIGTWSVLKRTTLYQVGNSQFVIKNVFNNAKKELIHSGNKNRGKDYLTVRIESGTESVAPKQITLEGGMGTVPVPNTFSYNGLRFQMEYGSIRRPIPYEILCRDFQLDKYPGSESPSSFASELTLIDPALEKKFNKRIFMNHVMDYEGYRFFQSSYTLDDPKTPENEEGTVLSVNYDAWGTNVTYLGYLLMAIGMILSVIAPRGRFKSLNTKLKKIKTRNSKTLVLVLLLIHIYPSGFAQDTIINEQLGHDHINHDHADHDHQKEPIVEGETFKILSKESSEEFSSLLVQSYEGRIIPAHTLCDQLLRKVHRDKYFTKGSESYSAVQTIVSMHMYPAFWMKQKIIYVARALQKRLNLEKHVAYDDIVDDQGKFKWEKDYAKSFQKLESKRDEFDKKIIKFHERFQVTYGIISWDYMKLIPISNDDNNSWASPLNMSIRRSVDSAGVIASLNYFQSIYEEDKKSAHNNLETLKAIQRKVAKNIVPSKQIANLEIAYNELDVFKRTYRGYGIIGLIMLILFFIEMVSKSSNVFKVPRKILFALLIGLFVFHASGLAMRWVISGHAPWSNGYEAVIFISWVSMLAGFFFSKKNAVVIAGTAILAALMIFVTEMNLLDPEITPLQPVLKSYWLMIHVAVITGSYGFLGLACILGLLNLILYSIQTKSNSGVIKRNINELTYVSEMTMTIGLFMLTIGTFLGGIWANESWGRYWGWDPKETWALVSVLVYAVILHLRFIPGLKSKFTFNLVAFWGYSAILFTFFGVNFVLVGLHSYAQGDGLSDIPNWIWYTALSFLIFSIIAYLRNKRVNQIKSS